MSDTQTPQGVLAIVKMPHYEIDELFKGDKTELLVLESIQDPGNLGTMIRTGEGAGVSGIIMNRTTVDILIQRLCAQPWAHSTVCRFTSQMTFRRL